MVSGHVSEKPFVASMGVYVFSHEVLLEMLEDANVKDFGKEVIPSAIGRYRVNAHLFRGYWQDVGTVGSFYDANIMLTRPQPPFNFYDSYRPIYTRPRFLPGSRLGDSTVRNTIVAEGCDVERATIEESVLGIRTNIQNGTSIRRSVLMGADYYEGDEAAPPRGNRPRLGIGRDVTLDRVIVDKNARIGDGARLVNAGGLQEADGPGYHIRNGIIIVPKDGVIEPGTVV
jgi:glucose-1-phosphate adenylyltransferase